jgi:molybdopterin/thiamine biosynthesis adenylyltransferase
VVDRDFVELDNLQRQMLYTEDDARERLPKAEAAARHLRAANSEVTVEPMVADINPFTIKAFADGLDVLVDGTDNFATRFLINDLAVSRGLPWVYGGVVGASGMTMTIVPGDGPCLRCLFPAAPLPGAVPTCDTAGVLGPAVGVVAGIQAAEVLKLLLEPGSRNRGLVAVDLWQFSFETISVTRDPQCPACGLRRFSYLEAEEEYDIVALCGKDAVQIVPRPGRAVDLDTLERRLAVLGPVRRNPFLLEVEVEGRTLTLFPDGRAIVQGVDDPGTARILYARYIGL